MFVPTRLVAIGIATLAASSCNRSVDTNLIGTWRAEDKSSIREVAFRKDHGFSTYYRYKPAPDELAALTNPSLLEDTGEWQLSGKRLGMTFKETNGAQLPASTTLIIAKLGKIDLVLKRDRVGNDKKFDYFGDALSFKRMDISACKQGLVINDARIAAEKIVGNWQVHYRTHDCRYLYKDDHSLEIFVDGEGVSELILLGTWRVVGQTLVHDLRSMHSSESEQQQWTLMGIGDDCFVINDHHAEYTFSRIRQ